MAKAERTPNGNVLLTDSHPARPIPDKDLQPDWETKCINCGEVPTVPATELCGPCTFGEADTAGGNW
jgi:hypothetical protein